MSVKENLIAEKALIDTPEKWGKGVGSYLVAESKPACAHEACRRVAPADHVLLRRALAAALPVTAQALGVPSFNDDPDTTHADVMSLFDRDNCSSGRDGETVTWRTGMTMDNDLRKSVVAAALRSADQETNKLFDLCADAANLIDELVLALQDVKEAGLGGFLTPELCADLVCDALNKVELTP